MNFMKRKLKRKKLFMIHKILFQKLFHSSYYWQTFNICISKPASLQTYKLLIKVLLSLDLHFGQEITLAETLFSKTIFHIQFARTFININHLDKFTCKSHQLSSIPKTVLYVLQFLNYKPQFVMTLPDFQKNPILVIETGTCHRNVIRRN